MTQSNLSRFEKLAVSTFWISKACLHAYPPLKCQQNQSYNDLIASHCWLAALQLSMKLKKE